MAQILKNLTDPPEFWEYFEIITTIPRCSGNEQRIREYVKKEAKQFGLATKEDVVGNLVVLIPANIDQPHKTIILQCHLDMVCEKNEQVEHDFTKDPISIQLSDQEQKKWVTANGTTLGADNGVGIAYLLTLMRKIHEHTLQLDNISLELLFTVDEEVGLVGAFNIDESLLTGEMLINLDSEEDDIFTIGCAGGINTIGTLEGEHLFTAMSQDNQIILKLSVEGLHGGHSGVDIHKGYGNAIKILTKILWKANNEVGIDLMSIKGGNRANAIPREASATLLVNVNQQVEIKEVVSRTISEIKKGISNKEPNLCITFQEVMDNPFSPILSPPIKEKVLHLLYIIPNGPVSYDEHNTELVYTSTNLAAVAIDNYKIQILTSQRSLHEISKTVIYEQIEAVFNLADMGFQIEHRGDYPGWTPNWDSALLKRCKETYQNLFNQEPKIQVIHAGLECGILKKHFPKMEAISIGPTILNPHSPEERLEVESIPKFWSFLIHLLSQYI